MKQTRRVAKALPKKREHYTGIRSAIKSIDRDLSEEIQMMQILESRIGGLSAQRFWLQVGVTILLFCVFAMSLRLGLYGRLWIVTNGKIAPFGIIINLSTAITFLYVFYLFVQYRREKRKTETDIYRLFSNFTDDYRKAIQIVSIGNLSDFNKRTVSSILKNADSNLDELIFLAEQNKLDIPIKRYRNFYNIES